MQPEPTHMMKKLSLAAGLLLGTVTTASAHQVWIEQVEGQGAIVRFGEFGENLREASPGLLDKFGKPAGVLVAASDGVSRDAARLDLAHYFLANRLGIEAIGVLERVVAKAGQFPVFRYHLGMDYLGAGNPVGAKQQLAEAVKDVKQPYPGLDVARAELAKL